MAASFLDHVDWQAIALILNAAAIAFAAVYASKTAASILKERSATRYSELAEEALVATYKAISAIEEIRNPIEISTRNEAKLPYSERVYNSFKARIDNASQYFDEIQEVRPKVRAFFGEEADANLLEIVKIRGKIILAVETIIGMSEGGLTNYDEEDLDMIKKARAIAYSGSNGKFDKSIEDTKNKLEAIFVPVIRSSPLPQKKN